MRARVDCIPCLFQQALNTARVATSDPALHEEVLRAVAERVRTRPLEDTPAGFSQLAYEVVAEVTGVADAYVERKRQTNAEALGLLPGLRSRVAAADDPLAAAVHFAAAGNVIDLGIPHSFDIARDVAAVSAAPFAVDDIGAFREALHPGHRLLYLGDNSGEIVFDRLLVEVLLDRGVEVTFTVKSGPIINDALLADAEAAGLTGLVPVIETGSNDIGVCWERTSPAFRSAYEGADLILSKGQGNFETVSGLPGNVYFLLKAKCNCVAEELGVACGDLVFRHRPA